MARPMMRSPALSWAAGYSRRSHRCCRRSGRPAPRAAARRPAQALDRVARVIVQLAALGAVQAVVEVVPPVALALGPAHDGGHADGGRPTMKRPGSAITRTPWARPSAPCGSARRIGRYPEPALRSRRESRHRCPACRSCRVSRVAPGAAARRRLRSPRRA